MISAAVVGIAGVGGTGAGAGAGVGATCRMLLVGMVRGYFVQSRALCPFSRQARHRPSFMHLSRSSGVNFLGWLGVVDVVGEVVGEEAIRLRNLLERGVVAEVFVLPVSVWSRRKRLSP